MLKEQGGWSCDSRCLTQARHLFATFHKVKAKYGGMDMSDARRLKTLEDGEQPTQEAAGRVDARQRDPEGCRRKKIVTPDARRKAVASCLQLACSEPASGVCRSTVRYTSTRPDDALLREAMKAVAGGVPAVRLSQDSHHAGPLGRWGTVVNQKKLRRLFCEEK